ncbi:MAG: serine/threonine protein kinase, partial [Oscillatoriales cyanobacterium SM2_1_8]|nr:serine/threonine protein kinase [Oscillatoriales cyanobacterium SM2_1_8]
MDILPESQRAIELPDFAPYGYLLLRELGRNPAGGRVVYLAQALHGDPANPSVVLKHFQFLKQTRWEGFRQIEREVAALQRLHHRGIPLYLGTFETADGFCLVQEYLPALPLSQVQGLSLAQVEDIARQVLDILIYLQGQQPPMVHRDIKPENLLWDENENVYLIDFGFARSGLMEASASSMAAGTFGFMAPEQLRNRELTLATDLYGLGATLICLLADLPSTSLDTLIDEDNWIRFRSLLPNLPYRWFTWLEGMVAPKLQHRFASAQEAKRALTGGTLVRRPKVKLPSELTLTAEAPGAVCIGTLNVTNTVADSILTGKWSVVPHPSDPAGPPDRHPWIALAPAEFSGFFWTVRVAVDTGALRLGEVYQRYLLLTTNAEPAAYRVLLTVTTAPLPALAVQNLALVPWLGLAIAGIGFGASCGILGVEVLFYLVVAGVGALSGGALGVLAGQCAWE